MAAMSIVKETDKTERIKLLEANAFQLLQEVRQLRNHNEILIKENKILTHKAGGFARANIELKTEVKKMKRYLKYV